MQLELYNYTYHKSSPKTSRQDFLTNDRNDHKMTQILDTKLHLVSISQKCLTCISMYRVKRVSLTGRSGRRCAGGGVHIIRGSSAVVVVTCGEMIVVLVSRVARC